MVIITNMEYRHCPLRLERVTPVQAHTHNETEQEPQRNICLRKHDGGRKTLKLIKSTRRKNGQPFAALHNMKLSMDTEKENWNSENCKLSLVWSRDVFFYAWIISFDRQPKNFQPFRNKHPLLCMLDVDKWVKTKSSRHFCAFVCITGVQKKGPWLKFTQF